MSSCLSTRVLGSCALLSLGFAGSLIFTGCGGGGGSGFTVSASPQQPAVNTTPLTVAASINNSGTVTQRTYDRLFLSPTDSTTGSNQGIGFDRVGNVYHAADNSSPGALRVLGNTFGRPTTFDAARDRTLGGVGTTSTTLQNPKGHDVARIAGFVLIADNGASTVTVFGTAATGDAPPFGVTVTPAPPWDVDYDETSDRLYVAMTNGQVAVYDGFGAGGWARTGNPATPSRTIVPSVNSTQSAINLHGIVYDSTTNSLIVSDVGQAANADDGAIYVISNASTANGATQVSGSLGGSNTLLGNPVDLDLFGTDLRVAEKANDKLLVFTDIFDTIASIVSGTPNVAPRISVDQDAPESVASRQTTLSFPTDASDFDGSNALTGVLVTQNNGGNGPVVTLNPDLTSQIRSFDPTQPVESAMADGRGDVYATIDSSLVVLNRVGRTGRSQDAFRTSRDRLLTGTGLVAAKGLDVVESRGVVIVADFGTGTGDSAIRVYGKEASQNAAALFTVSMSTSGSAGARVWDVDYAPGTDTLYAALTNGAIAVYTNFFANAASTQVPAILIPTGEGSAGARNCHGIVYDAQNDVLFVSDVGDAGNATDGEIFVIQNPPTTSQNVLITAALAGPATRLGNPVDIAYDGTHLYVAEKSNNAVLRFDNIRSATTGNPAPSRSLTVLAPESVCPLLN